MSLFGFPEGLAGGSKETEYLSDFITQRNTSNDTLQNTDWTTQRATSHDTSQSTSFDTYGYQKTGASVYSQWGWIMYRLSGGYTRIWLPEFGPNDGRHEQSAGTPSGTATNCQPVNFTIQLYGITCNANRVGTRYKAYSDGGAYRLYHEQVANVSLGQTSKTTVFVTGYDTSVLTNQDTNILTEFDTDVLTNIQTSHITYG